jgi:glycosyltransferase involved in cell wall biosynthesis
MTSPTPIALCITDLDPGGAERALVQVATRLDRTLWDPVVYCLSPRGEMADALESARIPTHCLNASRRDASVVGRLAMHLRRQRPALIQSFLFHGNLAACLSAVIARVPIVISGVRVAEREKRWHLRLERRTRRLVNHHVCVSKAVAEFVKQELRLSDDAVSVIPNGVDTEAISSAPAADLTQLGIPGQARTLLFVGRLHPQKGVSILLEAFQQLSAQYADLHLLIVGVGPLESQVQEFVALNALSSRVHVLGRRHDVPSLMKSATALVLPSLWEGMPNVVLEAMAARLPVVATAVDGTTELIIDEKSGWLCQPASADSLIETVRRVLHDPKAASDCAITAQQTVAECFTWSSVAARYSDLWRSFLPSQRRF